jgi:hypothetical protein
MNTSAVAAALKDFAKAHKTAFSEISARESRLLELGAVVAVHGHYVSNDFNAVVQGAPGGTFVVKTSTRGHPAKYSKIVVEKNGDVTEIHMNLLVRGAHDDGVYCVDVGLVRPGAVPERLDRKQKWICVENEALVTFAEVKRLVVYPMLLAQFVGIVHEIKPAFLGSPSPSGFDRSLHLPPALLALGHFSGNSAAIVRAYEKRSILLCIAENFDVRIAAHRNGTCRSPLYWDAEELEAASALPAIAPV